MCTGWHVYMVVEQCAVWSISIYRFHEYGAAIRKHRLKEEGANHQRQSWERLVCYPDPVDVGTEGVTSIAHPSGMSLYII